MKKKAATKPQKEPSGKSRRPFRRPSALVGAWIGLVVILAGAGGWVALASDEAVKDWRAAGPKVVAAIPTQEPQTATAPPTKAPDAASGTPMMTASKEMAAPPPAKAAPPADPNVGITLTPAPAPGLVEESKTGPLPKISPDGRKPWQVYARAFPATNTLPKIAIVMTDLGISGVNTGTAIDRLPPTVSLAFVPQADQLEAWIDRARTNGHEILLSLPMEPVDYPNSDPGPNALFTMLRPERNIERLETLLSKGVGYIGVTSTTGSKFTANARAMQTLVDQLQKRGLMYFDAKASPDSVGVKVAHDSGVPVVAAERVIDRELSRGAIDDQLKGLEALAKSQGSAVGLAFPYPTTIERIGLWAVGLMDRGVTMAPVSAVAAAQATGTGKNMAEKGQTQ